MPTHLPWAWRPRDYRFTFFFGAACAFFADAFAVLAVLAVVFFDAAPLLDAFFLPPKADVHPSEYFFVVPTRIIVTVVPFAGLNLGKAENARPDAARCAILVTAMRRHGQGTGKP